MPLNELDFQVCGSKPVGLGFSVCNMDTETWNAVGAVYPPGSSICGARPEGMSSQSVCDAITGEWQELYITQPPIFHTCRDEPPQNIKFPVCNLETGEWEEDHVVVNKGTLKVVDQEG